VRDHDGAYGREPATGIADPAESAVGTKRTNSAEVMRPVVRVDPEVGFLAGQDVLTQTRHLPPRTIKHAAARRAV